MRFPNPSSTTIVAVVLAAVTTACNLGGAEPEQDEPSEVAENALLSDVPELTSSDYAVDENAVYATASIGGQAGLFRFPVGAGAPAFIDGSNASRTRRYSGGAQIVGPWLYYAAEVYESIGGRYVPRRELMRAPRSGGAPVKVMDVPASGRLVVGETVVYIANEGNDYRGDISVMDLGAALPADPAPPVVRGEHFARDLVAVGDALFWRAGWAGLTYNGLRVRAFDSVRGARAIDLGANPSELQRILADGKTVYVLGAPDRVWSIDATTGTVSQLPSIRSRMQAAGVSYCGDEYPYGASSSAVRGGTLYAYCTSWNDRSHRFVLGFAVDGTGAAETVAPVASTRAWHFRASSTRLFWLETRNGDRFTLKSAAL